jgi:CheY-like chemotaxis protein
MNDNKDPTRAVVLVVEDEPSVRLMEVDMLDGAGFEVCAAASVSEALAVLDERQDVTVLVSDVQMPGRDERYRPRKARPRDAAGHRGPPRLRL